MAIKNYAEGGDVMSPSQFATYIFEGGRDATQATARGLEYLSKIGATPAEGVELWNKALNTSFGLNDFLRVADELGYKELSSGAIRPKSDIELGFEQRIYQGLEPGVGENDTLATLRGLQIAQQAGLTGQETVDLFNSALGFESGKTFTLEDIPRVEEEMTDRLGAPVTIPVDKPISALPTKTALPPPVNINPVGTLQNQPTRPGATQLGYNSVGGIGALRQVLPENINFANLAPQLRFATPQTNLITQAARPGLESVVRTLDAGTQKFGDRQAPIGAGQMSPGLRTAYEIGLGPSQYYQNIRSFLAGNPNADAIAAAKEQYGVSDVDIQRALGETRATRFAAPMTTQQKMRSYVGDVTAPDATLKGLQFVRNLGLDPAQATTLWNQTYGTNFNLDDYKRVMGEYGGLFGPAYERAPATTTTTTGSPTNLTTAGTTVDGGVRSVYGNTYSYPTGLSEDQVKALNAANVPPPGGDFTNYLLPPINYSDAPFSNLRTPDIGFIPMGGNLVEDWGDREQGTPATPGEIGSDILDFLNPFGGKKDDEAPPEAPETTDKYAGGPVTGSPQYFEEGGEVEPMRKYTPTELGSTFDISEYIDPETGRFMINEYRRDVVFNPELRRAEEIERARLAELAKKGMTGGGEAKGLGGIAMRGMAEEMRSAGRYGDTVLAHINPEEARILSQISGPPSINPETGLPEFFWKKLFGVVSKVLPFIPIPGLFGMSSLLTKSILSGLAAGASAKKGFDLKQALGGGLTAYALGSLGEKMGLGGGQAQAQAVDGSSMLAADGTTIGANALSPMELAEQQGGYGFGPQSVAPTPLVEAGSLTGTAVNPTVDMPTPTPNYGTYIDGGISTDARPTIAPEATTGLTTDLYTQGQGIGAPLEGMDIAMAGVGGLGMESAAKESRDQQMALAAAEEERKKKIERYNALARYYGSNIAFQPRTVRTGGLMALAGGGAIDPVGYEGGGMTAPVNQPRMLAGGGDGMSDSIPATIDGTQPARLADGEFVIPADVVADIGNGSSSAGAKRLYGMMDRVREARHGTTKQPPEIKMNRLMPA